MWTIAVLSVLALVLVGVTSTVDRERRSADPDGTDIVLADYTRTENGTVGRSNDGEPVVEFTDGSVTAVVQGPKRTFSEELLPDVTVTTRSWVRILPRPWSAGAEESEWFPDWYAEATDFGIDDVLSTAMQYVEGAPDDTDENGVRYRGNADFGDLNEDGQTRSIGGDFNDYLEVDWTYPDGTVRPANPDEAGYVDCSGFLRLLFGYRMGIELKFDGGPDVALPRHADDIGRHGPGNLLADTHAESEAMIGNLRPGDLVFFDTDGDGDWNHSGFYLGLDSAGDARFFSSRGKANGPTMSDLASPSLLDGPGVYAAGFTGVRRL